MKWVVPSLLGIIALSLLSGCLYMLHLRQSMPAMRSMVQRTFPEVQRISTDRLAAWLADDARPQPILLDVRRPEEFAVSHLPGAIRVDPGAHPRRVLDALPPGRPVVAYCSVGYRSSLLVQTLQHVAEREMYNLDGSLFQWANEGRAMVDENGAPTTVAHPYSGFWAGLLEPERRASLSAGHGGEVEASTSAGSAATDVPADLGRGDPAP